MEEKKEPLKKYDIKDNLKHLHRIEAEAYRQMADGNAYFITNGLFVASFRNPYWVKEVKK